MKKLLALSLLSVAIAAQAACEDKFAFGEPQPAGDFTHLCRSGYATIHNNAYKIPLASFEHLTPDTIGRGNVERKNAFREDPEVPISGRARLADYKAGASTYDRGHMADAQNASDDRAMYDTFMLSNMVPQVASFNRGMWKTLETHVAKMVRGGRDLYVISGSLAENPSSTIGNGVVVPTKLFKIVIDKNDGDAIAYLIPNEVSNRSYKDFALTIAELNRIVGVNLVPGAPDSLLNAPGRSLK